MINKEDIIKAYVILRKYDQTIPDETLDWIKEICLSKLEEENNINKIQVENLIHLKHYYGNGRNANVGMWHEKYKAFLTTGNEFGKEIIFYEPFGCFIPYKIIGG